MKIVFVSNYFNHHQKPFCEAMYKRFGADFVFIATSVMGTARKKLGYSQNDIPSYVLLSYLDEQHTKEAKNIINDATVAIYGSAPNGLLMERIRSKKLVFRYSERPFKKRISVARKMFHTIKCHWNDLLSNKVYLLCASAYAPIDYSKMRMYKNRMYKWGYFPKKHEHDVDLLFKNKKQNNILWCGRFIDWKHPDDAIALACKLKDAGYEFKLSFIGAGIMENQLRQSVIDLELGDYVEFLGSMTPENVRLKMEETGIYLFTSDKGEGWGAVLNESMNSGCAVVASHAIGSVPYLVKNDENGYIYQSGNKDMLFEKVSYLLDHPEKQRDMGIAAYKTIFETWNAEVSTDRFINLIETILSGEKSPQLYQSGPCSRAEIVKDDWFQKEEL